MNCCYMLQGEKNGWRTVLKAIQRCTSVLQFVHVTRFIKRKKNYARQAVSQSEENSTKQKVLKFCGNFLKAFQVNLKAQFY